MPRDVLCRNHHNSLQPLWLAWISFYFLEFIPSYHKAVDIGLNGTSLGRILEEYKIWSLVSDDYNLVGKIRQSQRKLSERKTMKERFR